MSKFSRISGNFWGSENTINNETIISRSYFNNCFWASILIVDDQNINRMILNEFGKKYNIISDEAENGKLAYNMYVKSVKKRWCNGYKLILMDLNMPILDGIRASYEILEYKTDKPKPKIVVVTAFASNEEKEKWFALGISRFEVKPITSETYKNILLSK